MTMYGNYGYNETNGMGIAGFVLSLVSAFLGWVPVLGWILWILGAVFSIVGLFRYPKGFAIAGTVLSFFWLILFMCGAGLGILAAFF